MSIVARAFALLSGGDVPAMPEKVAARTKKPGRNTAEKWHLGRVSAAGCVIGNRQLDACEGRIHVHHIADATTPASDFSTVGLCEKHHDANRSGSGLHGMSPRVFCRVFRVPGRTERGLLQWVNEDIARKLRGIE